MRRSISFVLGFAAAVMGLLIALPSLTYKNSIWVVQMLLNEFPWIPALAGTAAAALSASGRRRSTWGPALGLFGTVWTLIPFMQMRLTARLNDASLRSALGADYLQQIPPIMRARIPQRRWTFESSFGDRARRRTNACTVDRDIVYSARPQNVLKLDVYRPTVPPPGGSLYPAVVTVHGGAWRYGDKGEVFSAHHRYLASLGYVVFDIQYRLSEQAGWPAPLEDVQCAVAWVKHFAPAYQVDPARVALLGRSAGGHLALSAAYRAGEYRDGDASVAAVIAIYPPTDLRLWMSDDAGEVTRLLGGTPTQIPEAYREASPAEYVRDGLPPTLLVHGYRDDLVVPGHTELLHNKLHGTNTPAVTVRIPWGRHGFDALMSGLGAQAAQYDIDRFLAWALTRDRAAQSHAPHATRVSAD